MTEAPALSVVALDGIREISAGDDLAVIIGDAYAAATPRSGDILAVTSKIFSKAEGRMRVAADREAAIDEEMVRLVASREHPGGVTRIVEHRLGLVMAAAGVDASNTPEGTILLLPEDPDRSAKALAAALRTRFGIDVGVVMTDTFGRPWRAGQTDIAIGAAGIRVITSLAGTTDTHGRELAVTAAAVADEIAAAADLVKGKTSGRPVALLRGLEALVGGLDEAGASHLIRDSSTDMFRLGTAEAHALGYREGLEAAKQHDAGNAFFGGEASAISDVRVED